MLNERQETLLVSIINEYLRECEPVSSKLVEKSGFFGLSSATIRAVMNDLEELGYLGHLHTSGGRVPTDRAYRYFVNSVLAKEDYELDQRTKNKIKTTLSTADNDPKELNKTLAQLVANLSENLVITGIDERDEFYKTGISSLMGFPEFQEIDRVFQLTSFFDGFESMFALMQKEFSTAMRHINHHSLTVFIGRENPVREARDEAVIVARYNLPQNHTGSMTIVGPIRMDYKKNIGLAKFAAEELNKIAREV